MLLIKDFKIGIIGCGYWATNILKTLEDLGYKNIYVYDNLLSKSKLLKDKFKYIKIEKKLDYLIDNKNIDCFFLVTPASTHYNIGKKILKNKKNLFVEKPGTTNPKHLKELTSIAKKNKTIFMVGYVYNFNPYINYIKKVIASKTTLLIGDW
jgi:UDP-N-acetylglucosamine 3-dehydrogenase